MIIKKSNSINSIEEFLSNSLLTKAESTSLLLLEEIFYFLMEFFGFNSPENVKHERTMHLFSKAFTKLASKSSVPPEKTEDLVILFLMNRNPALTKIKDLIDDKILKSESDYPEIIMNTSFSGREEGESAVSFLLKPILHSPDDLEKQLQYILDNWSRYISPFIDRIKRGLDFFREERKPQFPPGPGPTEVITYENAEGGDNFSDDTHWMPNVIMIAKNTFVWFDQLSKKYKQSISRLDQIPEDELKALSDWGINTLWLIGLWERSEASKKIKNACGNPDAAPSAYALKNYEIAGEIGGWEALHNLKKRCASLGIRLASDMVPNHTGIDSDWVKEYPHRFIQLPNPPFPGYSFNGMDLSGDPDTGIFLEDHYYDKTDAAVVFKHVDYRTGKIRYIYHGNDGTSMPWNDTAQLNYLDKEVREAVINTIVHVASNFPVIRFDAAMTLAKKHIQRLWYPAPGQGGDIPSRAEHGLSNSEFNRLIPREFWKEVVERVAEEAPDTLLLAEAFWMMEGFFVKNLGMHRVYNSAFMNMLKREENGKFKETIKNTLTYDPEILKRFVNFMNNPDEDTAALQFGKGDKYFAVCTMLVTLPGLPMIGHGQIEGFEEKYGMEYKKAYYDEIPDQNLVERHEREIFPLMRMRYLFSEAAFFLLYDLVDSYGGVNDNVFVWSNRAGNQHTLTACNNSFESASGRIHRSAPKRDSKTEELVSFTLFQALDLTPGTDNYVYFTEVNSRLTYLLGTDEILERGIYIELPGYGKNVFYNFTQVTDTDGSWKETAESLEGNGTGDILRYRRSLKLRPAKEALKGILSAENMQKWFSCIETGKELSIFAEELKEDLDSFYSLLNGSGILPRTNKNAIVTFSEACGNLEKLLNADNIMGKYLPEGLAIMPEAPYLLLLRLILLPAVSPIFNSELLPSPAIEFLEDLGTGEILETLLPEATFTAGEKSEVINLGIIVSAFNPSPSVEENILKQLTGLSPVKSCMGINLWEGVTWFKREAFQTLTWWIYLVYRMNETTNLKALKRMTEDWILREEKSDCRIDKLLEL